MNSANFYAEQASTFHDFSVTLQAMLDDARKAINEPREAFRQKYLEAERKRLEEIEAQEAKLKADAEAKSPKGKKGSAKDKKSPSAKKKK